MASNLQFRLPEAPRPRPRVGLVGILTFLSTVATLALVIIFLRWEKAPGEAGIDAAEGPRLRKLAEDLERRTLYAEAAEAWAEYLALPGLPADADRAEIQYRRGKCLHAGGRHGEAARALCEVETLEPSSELKRKSVQLLLECLAALGKTDARALVARSFALGSATESGTVVAVVGGDAITREEIRERLLQDLERMLLLEGPGLTPLEAKKKAEEAVEARMKDPESFRRLLQEAVSTRLLYREALERGFGEDSATAGLVARAREEILKGRVIEEELARVVVNLSATDIANHYEAHKERFVEPAKVEFSLVRFATEGEAKAALEALADPARAASVAFVRSREAHAAGGPIPEVGSSAEAAALLEALEPGEVGDRALAVEGTWYLFRAEAKTPARPLALGEAEPRVRADLVRAKREEVLRGLEELLVRKFRPEIVDEAPAKTAPEAGQAPELPPAQATPPAPEPVPPAGPSTRAPDPLGT